MKNKFISLAASATLLLGSVAGVSVFAYQNAPSAFADGLTVGAVPSSGTIEPGSNLEVYFRDASGNSALALSGACTVNDADVSGSFQNLTDGLYRVTYTVGASDADRAAGQVPVSCALSDNASTTWSVSAFTDGNSVAISTDSGTTTDPGNGGTGTATPPDDGGIASSSLAIAQTSIIPDSGTLWLGDTADIYFTAANHETDLAPIAPCTVNGVNVADTFQNLTDGLYRVRYTASSSDTARDAGTTPISCSFQNMTGSTTSVHAFNDNNTLSIDLSHGRPYYGTTTDPGNGGTGTTTNPGGGTGTTTDSGNGGTSTTTFAITQVGVTPSTGTLFPRQSATIYFTAADHNTDVDLIGACLVNGVNVAGTYENLTDGLYRVIYTASSTDSDRAAGAIPIYCSFENASSTVINVSSFTDGNALAVNASGTTTDPGNGGTGTGTTTDSVLAVTSIEQIQDTAAADGTYSNGWKWIFHITVPDDETSFAMKFSDWTGSGTSTIAAGGNMRISSEQSSALGTVNINSSDTYSPDIELTSDLDSSAPGRQIAVTVEMKVPSGSANGSYSTSYGVKSH